MPEHLPQQSHRPQACNFIEKENHSAGVLPRTSQNHPQCRNTPPCSQEHLSGGCLQTIVRIQSKSNYFWLNRKYVLNGEHLMDYSFFIFLQLSLYAYGYALKTYNKIQALTSSHPVRIFSINEPFPTDLLANHSKKCGNWPLRNDPDHREKLMKYLQW